MESLEPRAMLATDLVISEFLASNITGLADEDGAFSDWIEIRNTSAASVNLAGWALTDEAADLDKWLLPAQSLDAGGYLVVFASSKNRSTAGAQLHTNFKLSNDGEYLALVRPGGLVADEYTPEFPEQYNDVSYGSSVDLATRGYFPAPTPGAVNAESPIADPTRQIVISEIMYHPASENDAHEYIELYNKGQTAVNLTGWQITSGVTFTFPNLSIGAGQYLAVAANLAQFQAIYPAVTNVVAGWTGSLSNSGEAIEISDPGGVTIDRVEYADEGDWSQRGIDPVDGGWTWVAPHDGGAQSLELVNWRLSNNYGSNWRASSGATQGTPGAANSQAQVNSPPLVIDVEHFPVIPKATSTVTVTARILDEATTGHTVTAFYRANGAANFSSIVMNDAGTGGDVEAGDGTFSANLPAQGHNVVVEYFVQAKDAFNATRTWPAPTQANGQITNAMYQVDNNYDALAAWDPNAQPIYRLVMTTTDFSAFSVQPRGSNAQTNATFVAVDGTGTEVHHLAGVRFRGNSSRNANPPPLRIEFPEDNRFNSDDNMNVNSRSSWLQLAGSAVFRLAGLPAAETLPVQVRLNGANGGSWGAPANGSYARMEVLDGEFLDRAIPDDSGGNLYKKNRSPSNPGTAGLWAYRAGNVAAYQADAWIKQTNTGENDWSDLDHFLDVMNNTPAGPGYFDAVNSVIDVDQWVRWLAVMQIMNSRETNLSNGADDDYQMYRGEIDQRFILLPHDLDNIFGQGDGGTVQPTWHGIFQPIALQSEETAALDNLQIMQLGRFFDDPEIIRRYYSTLRELVTTVFAPERLNPLLDDALGSFVPQATINAMKAFAAAKNAHVLSLIPSQFSLSDGLPVVDGYPRTDIPTVAFTGTADAAQVQSVTVGGQLATWEANSGTWVLPPGSSGSETLITAGSQWRYLTDGSNQGTAWRAAAFNDSTWPVGTSEFGYGDGDETTTISNTRTTYFRKAFSVQNAAAITSITVNLLRDDGAVVYLNGAELFRDNMPSTTISNTTRASEAVTGAAETTFFPFTFNIASLPPGVTLSDGINVIAVELHQRALGADVDGGFNLSLTAQRTSGPLKPGINRVLAQAFTGAGGGGEEVWREWRDIWYDDGNVTTVSTNLPAGTTTWTAAAGPYHVTADITVPAGATLVIQPGTTVFFNANTGLTVNGTLQAVGTPLSRIRFTRLPSATGNWDGIRFVNSTGANQLGYFDQAYGDVNGRSIQATGSVVSIDNGEWFNTIRQILDFGNSSFSLTNSVLPDIQSAEMVHMSGFPAGGFVLIQGNTFGRTTGYNDVLDLTGGNRPGPIVQILDNWFWGCDDDILDLDGTDAHIEGNVFMSTHHGAGVPAADTSSAISGGADSGNTSELTIVRNFFYDQDHALLVKEGNSATLVNNTMHHITVAAINFEEPGNNTAGPGLGVTLDGNIISDTPLVFQNTNLGGSTTQIVINRTLTPAGTPYIGVGNLIGVPKFVNSIGITDPRIDLQLAAGSPGTAAGPNGVDMGAGIPGGATISGEPPAETALTSATLTVGGPDIFGYKFRVNGGAWSAEQTPATPIVLAGLANGSYTVHVAAKNSAGFWQPDAEATASRTWTVNTALSKVLISEVLASNVATFSNSGMFPDVIELVNLGGSLVDLAGMSISDTPANPTKFVFPTGTVIPAGQRLLLFADSVSAAPGVHLGFSLDATGEGVYLYNAAGSGGGLADSIVFGPQLADLSIGRVGHDSHWALNTPSLGASNVERFTGDTSTLKINEWFTSGLVRFDEDYLELYNPDPQPVNLAGLYLSDDPAKDESFHAIPPLSFVAGSGYIKFVADDNLSGGGDHLPFQLSSDVEILGLYTNTQQPIHEVLYFSQTTDIAQGLNPDGGTANAFYALPTPDVGNPPPGGTAVDDLVTFGSVWSFLDNGTDQETSWRLPGFNDASWVTGAGELGYGDGDEQTVVSFGPDNQNKYVTTYFRRHVNVPAGMAAAYTQVMLDVLYDDGVCVYVNGVEIGRTTNLPGTIGDNQVLFDTLANLGPSREDQVESFIVPLGLLQDGDNVIAVEVHQVTLNSSDLSFDLTLRGTRNVPPPPIIQESLDFFNGLRITEIMYNPADPDGSEYIELQNIGSVPLPIGGARISGGVSFTFPTMTLAPGQRTVVVGDLAAFREQFGTTIPVAGVFTDSLSNGGERLILQMAAPYDAAALRFDYQDDWFPLTDGEGYSLVVANTAAPASAWDDRSTWDDGTLGGTPGRSETDPAPIVLTVNSLETTDTTPPLSGTINYPSAAVTVTVGGQSYPAVNNGNGTWSLADNTVAPLSLGVYDVVVSAPDGLGNTGTDVTTGELSIVAPPGATVVGRHIFYNQSFFDGNSALAGVADDGAIAPDKTALLPGSTAAFANYTSYSKGINGIMIDLANAPSIGTISASDFAFRVGNTNNTISWTPAPAPTSVTVRSGAGTSGSDRVTVVWGNNVIQRQWLQVTLLATASTSLVAPDVFYFGNAIGEAGDTTTNALVNATDEILARSNPRTILNPAPINFVYDYTRDGLVNATDQIQARVNVTNVITALRLIVPSGAPAAEGLAAAAALDLAGDGDDALEEILPGLARRRRGG